MKNLLFFLYCTHTFLWGCRCAFLGLCPIKQKQVGVSPEEFQLNQIQIGQLLVIVKFNPLAPLRFQLCMADFPVNLQKLFQLVMHAQICDVTSFQLVMHAQICDVTSFQLVMHP